jgi:hypothetical protein
MFLRIVLVAALAVAVMVAIKDGALRRAGLVGGCTSLAGGGADVSWESCTRGRLAGYPDLSKQSCVFVGTESGRDLWRCPAPVVSSQTPAP